LVKKLPSASLRSTVVAALDLSADDWAVLGVVAERRTHGYAVAMLLARDGQVGQVWSLERSDVYNALKKLIGWELVSEFSTEPGDRGRARTVLGVTPAGRRRVRKWLGEPVEHVRDVRNLLLLKLVLLDRPHRDPTPLIDAQVALLTSVLDGLQAAEDGAEGFERVVNKWRTTSCRAALEFLARVRPEA
jgi:DNA-binding PadR family transcriptional regulator